MESSDLLRDALVILRQFRAAPQLQADIEAALEVSLSSSLLTTSASHGNLSIACKLPSHPVCGLATLELWVRRGALTGMPLHVTGVTAPDCTAAGGAGPV